MKRDMRFNNWYPNDIKEIKKYFFNTQENIKDAIGMIVPHAGWKYSGKTAGIVYSSSEICDTYIILCPNHTGLGSEIAVYPAGAWETPLGYIEVDEEIAKAIVKNSKYAEADFTAHLMEHSIEVQLPFIKVLNPDAKIVPICMMTQDYEKCKDLADAIFNVLKSSNKKTVLIASSDMSHYADASIAKICDDMAISHILSLDGKGLLETVIQKNISMCGVAPATTVILYSNMKEATKAELLRYSNSGEITGDFSEVVGYAGIVIY